MQCPQCNEEMRKGYVHSPHAILWSESDEAAVVGGEEVLASISLFKMKKLAGYKCEECKVVTFKYDQHF